MKKTIILCLFCMIFYGINAQDSNYVKTIICKLSADAMYGRGYAYGGDSIAADFLVSELKKIGATPFGKEYAQPYQFKSFAMEGKVSLRLDGKLKSPLTDYLISPTALETHGKYNIIKADPKILFNDEELQKFRDKNENILSQIFVYIDVTNIKCNDEERKKLNHTLNRLNYANLIGSRGILIRTEQLPVWTWAASEYERDYTLIHLDSKSTPKRPKTIDIDFNNRFHLHNTQNICAMIEGTTAPDTFIVFTAHYDHLGCMGSEVIFHGAHDNASGVASVLDLLRYYKEHPHKYSVAALFFSGEEAALKGSAYYIEHPLFPIEDIALLINLDLMCGGDDGITIVNANSEGTKPFFDTIIDINKKEKLLKEIKPRDNAANSDHFYFSRRIPAIFIYTLGGRIGGYHHWSDTCENCGLESYENRLGLIIKAIGKRYGE